LGRQFLGIEREAEFVAMSKARREEIERIENYAGYRRKIQDIMKAEERTVFALARVLGGASGVICG
jgi:hypothetical protein